RRRHGLAQIACGKAGQQLLLGRGAAHEVDAQGLAIGAGGRHASKPIGLLQHSIGQRSVLPVALRMGFEKKLIECQLVQLPTAMGFDIRHDSSRQAKARRAMARHSKSQALEINEPTNAKQPGWFISSRLFYHCAWLRSELGCAQTGRTSTTSG